jgi:hypothetical protein
VQSELVVSKLRLAFSRGPPRPDAVHETAQTELRLLLLQQEQTVRVQMKWFNQMNKRASGYEKYSLYF